MDTEKDKTDSETPKKKAKRNCYFNKNWLNDDKFKNWLSSVSYDNTSAMCKLCNCKFTIKYQGLSAIESHINSNKHKESVKAKTKAQSLVDFFPKKSLSEDLSVVAYEVTSVYHNVIHHNSYLSLDCHLKLIKKILPDSKIAQKTHCGRTKSEAIVENVSSPHSIEVMINKMREMNPKPYSISSDASNKGNLKHFPLVITFFDNNYGVKNFVLDFYEDSNETSDAIAAKIEKILKDYNLDLLNLVSYSADNAAVNYGKFHSVFTNLQKINSNIIKANCNCHVLHNAAKHAIEDLPYDVESLVIKVYNEFSSSAKNNEKFERMLRFCR
jgi:hypothetical protein